MPTENSFSEFVSLACHDLRTPLATVSGFAHTLHRTGELAQPAGRYVEMIQAASEQIAELLDDLGLVARLEAGRYAPSLVEADTLDLVRAAAGRLGEGAVTAGSWGAVRIDREPVERGLAAFGLCVLRHGALERVDLTASGPEVTIAPVKAEVGPIVLGEDLKDLGAFAGRRVVEALGGSVAVERERLLVRLPI